jgi:hypothetical protein
MRQFPIQNSDSYIISRSGVLKKPEIKQTLKLLLSRSTDSSTIDLVALQIKAN